MKCIICHGEKIEKRPVREERNIGNDIIYIPVEVLECLTCGERYYDRKTMRYLEDIEKKLQEGKADVKDIGKVKILAA
jgi:YgiT-type zinc finger domain-containing protein